MAILRLDELQPGMVLAADAVHLNGRTLLRAGVTLTEQHMRVFRMWGLSEADIEGIDPDQLHSAKLASADPDLADKLRTSINERFRFTDSTHPMIVELYRWCLEQDIQSSGQ